MPPPARTLSGGGVLDRAGRKLPRQSRPRGHRAVVRRESGRALAIRHSGDVLLGGAPGAGGLLLNTKASQEAACSCAPAAIVPGQEPESHLAGEGAAEGLAGQMGESGMSGNAENGSHMEAMDAAEGHARQVDSPGSSGNAGNGSHLAAEDVAEGRAGQVGGPGSSGNAENGSHLEATDFSNEPGAVLWRHTPPHRTESGLLSYGTASPDSSVQKTALWRTRAHLSAGAARGGGSSAGRRAERAAGASGSWWRIVVAQVRRKSMMARWLQSRCDTCPIRAVADKCLIMSRIMICPVWFC